MGGCLGMGVAWGWGQGSSQEGVKQVSTKIYIASPKGTGQGGEGPQRVKISQTSFSPALG